MTTDEEKISSIYQQGKEQGPPAHLDSAILKAAHEAVEQAPSVERPSTAKSPFSSGWPAMASIAAVLLLTVILIPLIKQDESLSPAFDMADGKQGLMKQQPDVVDTLGRGKQVTAEEAIAPMRAISATQSPGKSKPTSKAVGTTRRHEQEYQSDTGIQMLSSPMLATDIASDAIDKKRSTVILAPEKWLKKIRQLIDEGELDAAKAELDKFKASYPHEKIDQSIIRQITERP